MQTAPDDLVSLTSLDMEAIVATLRARHEQKTPYTTCNGVLVSVNPNQWLPLYSPLERRAYMSGGSRAPHPYVLATRALKRVRRGESHTLLITGESGAGKTEMARICLEFVSFHAKANVQIERILQTGQVLEYIGNAQTVRNHNSSRFGKFLRLFYDGSDQCGASVQTYLLERGRIANNNVKEGTFRVVYALMDDRGMRDAFALHAIDRSTFGRPEAGCKSSWSAFVSMLSAAGFEEEASNEFAAMISGAVFLLTRDFASASQLFGLETQRLTHVLSNRRTRVKTETIWTECSTEDARQRSKALSMAVYSRMFDRTVSKLNEFIGGVPAGASLNVLDIFGFEALCVNGLEQLCINYCNERMQALFIDEVVVQQQLEYAEEGVECSHVRFDTSSHILELCERHVFPRLNESTRLRSSPEAFVETMSAQRPIGLSVPLVRKDRPTFTIEHYAQPVSYCADTMIERNTNDIRAEIVEVMRDASNLVVADLFKDASDDPIDGKMWSATTTSVFCHQMKELTAYIASTQSLYARCIRPNAGGGCATEFDDGVVSEQIAANGIVHACNVMRSGYEFRMRHQRFAQHFPRSYARGRGTLSAPGGHWGRTMVFMSASCHEHVRREEACLLLQSRARSLILRARRRRRAAIIVQCAARRRGTDAGKVRAARVVQRAVRRRNRESLARWRRLDEIARLKVHIIDLRRELKAKDAWIFRASQALRRVRPDLVSATP